MSRHPFSSRIPMPTRFARFAATLLLALASAATVTAFAAAGPGTHPSGAPHIWLPLPRVVVAPPQQAVPVLQIAKSDNPDPVTPGALLEYALVYTNAGSATARNVFITETYPAGVTFVLA